MLRVRIHTSPNAVRDRDKDEGGDAAGRGTTLRAARSRSRGSKSPGGGSTGPSAARGGASASGRVVYEPGGQSHNEGGVLSGCGTASGVRPPSPRPPGSGDAGIIGASTEVPQAIPSRPSHASHVAEVSSPALPELGATAVSALGRSSIVLPSRRRTASGATPVPAAGLLSIQQAAENAFHEPCDDGAQRKRTSKSNRQCWGRQFVGKIPSG